MSEKKIYRNESTSVGKRVWNAVDKAAARAPKKAVQSIKSKGSAATKKK